MNNCCTAHTLCLEKGLLSLNETLKLCVRHSSLRRALTEVASAFLIPPQHVSMQHILTQQL